MIKNLRELDIDALAPLPKRYDSYCELGATPLIGLVERRSHWLHI